MYVCSIFRLRYLNVLVPYNTKVSLAFTTYAVIVDCDILKFYPNSCVINKNNFYLVLYKKSNGPIFHASNAE